MSGGVIGTWILSDLIAAGVLAAVFALAVWLLLRRVPSYRKQVLGCAAAVLLFMLVVALVGFKMRVTDAIVYATTFTMCAGVLMTALLAIGLRTDRWQGMGLGGFFIKLIFGALIAVLLAFIPARLGTGKHLRGGGGAESVALWSLYGFVVATAALPLFGRVRTVVQRDRMPTPTPAARNATLAFGALFIASGISVAVHGLLWGAVVRFALGGALVATFPLGSRTVPQYLRTLVGGPAFIMVGCAWFLEVGTVNTHQQASRAALFYLVEVFFVVIGAWLILSSLRERVRGALPAAVQSALLSTPGDPKYRLADLELRSGETVSGVGIVRNVYVDRRTCSRKLDAREVVAAGNLRHPEGTN